MPNISNTLKKRITSNFSIIPNKLTFDSNLSLKAKGLFTILNARPDNWEFFLDEITSNSTDGKSAVKSGVKELEKLGYLSRERKRGDSGIFDGWRWILHFPPKK